LSRPTGSLRVGFSSPARRDGPGSPRPGGATPGGSFILTQRLEHRQGQDGSPLVAGTETPARGAPTLNKVFNAQAGRPAESRSATNADHLDHGQTGAGSQLRPSPAESPTDRARDPWTRQAWGGGRCRLKKAKVRPDPGDFVFDGPTDSVGPPTGDVSRWLSDNEKLGRVTPSRNI